MPSETEVGGIAADRLISIVERIERLESEKKDLSDHIKDIFAEAASAGFEVKVIRQVIKERKMDPDDLKELLLKQETYRKALGMLADLPLGQAAMERSGGRVVPIGARA